MEIIYETHDAVHKIEMDIYKNRKLFNDLYVSAIDVRIPSEETVSNYDAYWHMDNEGAGYFVQHYYDAFNFKDKKTRQLFKKAQNILNELEAHLEQFKEDEDDENNEKNL